MNFDKNKLDELFSEEESTEAQEKAKSKVRAKAKVKPEHQYVPDAEPDIELEDEPEPIGDPAPAPAATDVADDIPDEDKEEIILNPGKVTNTVFDWLGSLLIALVTVLLVMSFCFRVIDVDGTSMEPTLVNTDKVIITDLFYTPHNGDIIVISHGEEFPKPLVKRVIAIPGQKLRIEYSADDAAGGKVYIDDQLIDESAYAMGVTVPGENLVEELKEGYVIPEGKLFVMGDNRAVSLDSRSTRVGLIDIDCVIGKAQLDVIPHSYKEGQISGKDMPGLDLSRIRYLY